ncbi:MAG: Asp-tRNA(Asn)/Glu-tRNA(Gln) amidotransferase subunit GatA [bacterium]|nr:Asp-tRNA(Asn)/Glu-tRNA(Gln) amidotransferase subunit GatA [bacterium]
MSTDLTLLSLIEASEGIKNRQFSSRELTEAYVEKIRKSDKKLNAFLEVFEDVYDQADLVDQAVRGSSRIHLEQKFGSIGGVPIALKDNILVRGKYTAAASRILDGYKATYDSFVVLQLRKTYAIVLGHTNCDEFAMGGTTEHSAHGPTRNPHNHEYVPGGSSGGSAAAVAAKLCGGALGSDTGGSIRQPASFCGVVGLKPTYGRVSRNGIIAMASSLDQVGPMAPSVRDTKALFDAIRGHDPRDATSLTDGYIRTVGPQLHTKRIAVPQGFVDEGLHPEVKAHFERTLVLLEKNGYAIDFVNLEYIDKALAVYYIIMPAEASTNLARYDGMRYGLHEQGKDLLADYINTRTEGFGNEVRRRILLGTFVLSAGYYDAYYRKAMAVRYKIQEELRGVFAKGYDAIITPTAPTPAYPIGEKIDDPLSMYLGDIFTVPANIAGLPSISVPAGLSKDGLPIGVQFTGDLLQEDLLFALATDTEMAWDGEVA